MSFQSIEILDLAMQLHMPIGVLLLIFTKLTRVNQPVLKETRNKDPWAFGGDVL